MLVTVEKSVILSRQVMTRVSSVIVNFCRNQKNDLFTLKPKF